MKILIFIIYLVFMPDFLIHDFSPQSAKQWKVVDDGVMGGQSKGNFYINKAGSGVFSGSVSLANNGGFTSIRHDLSRKLNRESKTFRIRLKGDGKNYQFRIKTDLQESGRKDFFSFFYEIKTNQQWQEIEIPFSKMKATFRGRLLDKEPYLGSDLYEIGFLIANKKAEDFNLEIDWIKVGN